jgi:small-conductance mechanosensitive channel
VSRNDTGDIVVKDKTLVFSASGALQQQQQQQRISNDDGRNGRSTLFTTISPSRQFITTTQQVLQELKERLSHMDRAEEVCADGTRMEDLDAQLTTVQKEMRSTSCMFLGPSGDVLAELKNAIQNGEKDGHCLLNA